MGSQIISVPNFSRYSIFHEALDITVPEPTDKKFMGSQEPMEPMPTEPLWFELLGRRGHIDNYKSLMAD